MWKRNFSFFVLLSKQKSNYIKVSDKILFLDTETGGINPFKNSLLSIAFVVWSDFKIIDYIEVLINDGILDVTKEALEINKINLTEHVKIAKSPDLVIKEILDFLMRNFSGGEKITLAGHNINFDVNFFRVFLNNYGIEFHDIFSHRYVDTSSILYYLYLAGKIKYKAISSQQAFDLFQIEVPKRHTAMADALATAELFTKLLLIIKKRFKGNLEEELSKQIS
jgi:DNA polymerase-3 subunit epsilon